MSTSRSAPRTARRSRSRPPTSSLASSSTSCPRATTRSDTTASAHRPTSARVSNRRAVFSGQHPSSLHHRPRRAGSSCSSRSADATSADARDARDQSRCTRCRDELRSPSREHRHHERASRPLRFGSTCELRAAAVVRLPRDPRARSQHTRRWARRATSPRERSNPPVCLSRGPRPSRITSVAHDARCLISIASAAHAAEALFITTFARRRVGSNCARIAAARTPPWSRRREIRTCAFHGT